MNEQERGYLAKKVTLVGFFVNAVLTAIKIIAGVLGNSAAMIADGAHSLSDFFTDIVVLVGFKFIEKPEDEDHNYGHGKYETFSTLVISFALFLVGYKIFINGFHNIYHVLFDGLILEKPKWIALIAAIVSIISKELLYQYTKKIGEKINSPAVIANGWHHRSDAFSSIGTLIGIGGAIVLGDKWTILDPIASVIVSVFIFKVAFDIFVPSMNELMESSLSKSDLKLIQEIISASPQIKQYHHLRTRKVGIRVAIEVHLMFDAKMSIYDAHEFATEIENKLKSHFGSKSLITTHLEPSK